MESAAKRKAAGAAASENDARPSKRQKVPADADAATETAETTTTKGLLFLESLRGAKDKTGRPIATHFLTLPDKKQLPEYYDVIKLPIAIDTMEDKLKRGAYPSLAQVESDCKRLVNNAKVFNDKKSLVYEDAERLRKTASNWMVKHNPAYRIKGYSALPTPIPGEEDGTPSKPTPRPAVSTPKPAVATPDTAERPRRAAAAAGAQAATPAPSKLRHTASVAPEADTHGPEFEGKNFQQAQEQLVKAMIDYVDPESDLQIFQPFVNLPSRSLKDYYQLIKHPMSLSAVQKKVRGVVGREPPTGMTTLKSWQAFEDEMSLIWANARDYNEDGSDLYNLAGELEDLFKQRLSEAKAQVEEPPQPKLKLNMSAAPKQQLKIKLRQSPGSDPNTPAARSSATPGFIVDNEALLRQQRHVQESMNGTRSSQPPSAGKPSTPNPFSGPRGGSASIAPLVPMTSKTAGSPPATNGIKHDVQSPALNSIRPASTTSDGQSQRLSMPAQTPHPVMPPPPTTSRPASGSPLPNGTISLQTGSYPPHSTPNYHVPTSTPHYDHIRQIPLRNISEALIPKIVLTSAPTLNGAKPFSITIPAHKQKTTQSATINLPPSHSSLQIVPHIPVAFSSRGYRIFYQLNGKAYSESLRTPPSASMNGSTPTYEGGKKKGEPLYEAKLAAGVNRIEFEVVAERDRKGKPDSKDPKELIDVEKCTIFVNLLRGH
ncbi:Bromodomain-containing protein [Lophiostoma macrostomum CBS 122681]|uniref:Bromodomain-containing protein n=1 Tax=Lophiostoma macrostomum CBS 122681 TaxID=1314788 RepID=A0A6A6SRH0_9PLEO|nr:Bromodomain-containing protein [Lophiostoma macrostomum CBS 122681]